MQKTCYGEREKRNISCDKKSCSMWLEDKENINCCIIKAKRPHTLQEIGDLFGITRMRVCQIEKAIMQKVRSTGELESISDV